MQIGVSWVNTNLFPLTPMLCLLSKLLITVGLPIKFCVQRECNDHSFIQQVFIEHDPEVLPSWSLQCSREMV